MSRIAIYIPLVIAIIFSALLMTLISSCAPPSGSNMFGDRIGLLYVEGVITSGQPADSFFITGGTTSDRIVEVVNQAIDDDGIRALVVRINSPGGSAAGSQEIYDAFDRFKNTGRPVIVSMADVAASGGYYIAAPADEIFANPATLTGSIGVIMELLNYEGLYELIGLSDTTIKSGEFKDIGNPTRPMTDEERSMLQTMADQVHDQFRNAVMEGRGFTEEEIEEVSEGMVYNGEQALELKLIDKLGGLQDAIDRASEIAGLGDDPVIDELGKTGLLDQLLEDMGAAPGQSSLYINGTSTRTLGPALNESLGPALNGALNPAGNPFYRLWSLILLDPRFMGDNAGMRY